MLRQAKVDAAPATTSSSGRLPLPLPEDVLWPSHVFISCVYIYAFWVLLRHFVEGLFCTKVERAIHALNARERASLRDKWCQRVLKEYPQLKTISYRDAMSKLRFCFTRQTSAQKAYWFAHALFPERFDAPLVPSKEDLFPTALVLCKSPPQTAACGSGGVPEDGQSADLRLYGFLFTWNGKWGWRNPDIQHIMQSRDLPEPVLVRLVQSSPFYAQLWRDFQRQMTSVVGQQGWPRWSCCAEMSLKRKHSANLLHFHLAVSDPGRNHRLGRLAAWAFQGSTPVPKGTNGRGRHLIRALDGAHYYTQAPKRGRVYQACNYAAFTDFPVEMNTIFGLWRMCKLTDEAWWGSDFLAQGTLCCVSPGFSMWLFFATRSMFGLGVELQ